MKPKKIVMYIVDDNIILWQDFFMIEKVKKNIIKNGKIAKPQEFIKCFESILKKYKLNKNIITNINVLIEPNYTQADTMILNNILDKLSFNKIEFISIISLLDINKQRIWLIVNKNYLHLIQLNYKNKIETIFIDYKLFKKNINLLIKHLSIFLKRKQVILVGSYNCLEALAVKIEKESGSKTYYIEDSLNYFISKIKNTSSI